MSPVIINGVDELGPTNIPADVDKIPKSDSTVSWNATALAAINAEVDTALNTAVPGVPTADSVNERVKALDDNYTAARAALLDQITALRMAELDAANIPADVDTLLARLTALRAGYLDNINQAGLLQVTATRAGYLDELGPTNIPADVDKIPKSDGTVSWNATALASINAEVDTALNTAIPGTPTADSINERIKTMDDTGVIVNSQTAAYKRLAGVPQVIEVSITAAANAGLTTVATITTQPCVIDSIVIHADAAQTANMTTCAVKGGASQVVTFISTTDATQANLNAADKQVSWVGAVRLAATKTIIIDLQGTGVTAVDLTIVITYHASVDGGYLA